MANLFAQLNAAKKINVDPNPESLASLDIDATPDVAPEEKQTASSMFANRKVSDANVVTPQSENPAPDFNPATNDVLEGLELPPEPDLDASPEEVLQHQFLKLEKVSGHITAERDLLAELHTYLQDHHEIVLTPLQEQTVTRIMETLTKRSHAGAQVQKAKSQKRAAKADDKKEAIESVADAMGSIF